MRPGLCRVLTGFGVFLILGCTRLSPRPSPAHIVVPPTPRSYPATSLTPSLAVSAPSRSAALRESCPTPTAPSTGAPSSEPTPRARWTSTVALEPTPTATDERLTLTILFDNYGYDKRLKTVWGFSCLVQWGDLTLLFDAGSNASILLSNMAALGVDPATIDHIVLSHSHNDHVGGLGGVLAATKDATVYLPHSFSPSYQKKIGASARVVQVREPVRVTDCVHTTGVLGRDIPEQALVLRTSQGLVIVTGCAHPGIVDLVTRAQEMTGEPVYLVVGGFHLSGASTATIRRIVDDFQAMGVRYVAPTHCSGDRARALFEEAYGDRFIRAGVGKQFELSR